MNNTKYRGDILSFSDLLIKHKVEIPIIQRDYAQGRKDKKEIRNKFLDALHLSITDKEPIKLDFIYGSTTANDVFQPLDGQQRLTTLYLLHWYAANLSNIDSTKNLLDRFSYETRITSRDFCKELVSNNVIIKEGEILSEQIINASWFFLSWKKIQP